MKVSIAGESHGKCLVAIITDLPSNIELREDDFLVDMKRRQTTYGRGQRQDIEVDKVQILSGVRNGVTIGSPVTLMIENLDYENHKENMDLEKVTGEKITTPRPGHADLVGITKYDFDDIYNVSEHSSARKSALDVAIGVIAKKVLASLDIKVTSELKSINNSTDFKEEIDQAKQAGNTLGGEVKVSISGLAMGLGSYTNVDKKLDVNLGKAIMGVNLVKGFLIGENPNTLGSKYLDQFSDVNKRVSNNQGGIEGGMSNGQDINIDVFVKPVPTLYTPLNSFDINTLELEKSHIQRSDTCVVQTVGIILEAVIATQIMNVLLDTFYADTLQDLQNSYELLVNKTKRFEK